MLSAEKLRATVAEQRQLIRPGSTILKLHTHQSLETKCIKKGSPYRIVFSMGGIRSGKTLVIARWMIDRGKWDTAQFHGLFAYTGPQLHGAILGEVLPWVELAGIQWVYGRRPPAEWIEVWRKRGIKIPPRLPKYTNVLILSSGLHIYCGTMHNKSYRQVKGMKFGSIVIEEIGAGPTEEAIRYLFERVNCGIGPVKCAEQHHHVKILHSNIPDEDGHWIYEWLSRHEKRIAKKVGVSPSEAFDDYPCLLRGVGDMIYIKSRTIDNADNLPAEFIDDMEGGLDHDTAERVLGGNPTRKRTGRAYNAFDRKNIYPIAYDPDRTLYVFFDFNTNPTVAGFAHPLKRGEYPSEFHVDGMQYEGVFGEFFHVGGMDAHQLALALARGEESSHGYMPSNWRGIKSHRGPVIVFGDAKGGSRRPMTGVTPWSIVNEVLREAAPGRYSIRVPTENPLQQVRIRSLNGRLCNARDERLLFVDPNLNQLLTDLDVVVTNPDGTIKKPGGPRPGTRTWWWTHLTDGLGYFAYAMHPMGRDVVATSRLPKTIRSRKTSDAERDAQRQRRRSRRSSIPSGIYN